MAAFAPVRAEVERRLGIDFQQVESLLTEIATDVRLRDAYQLKDGDWVEIEFP